MQSTNGGYKVGTRIYGVQDNTTGNVMLVEAFDAPRALAFVAKENYDVKPMSASAVAKMIAQGYKVMQAQVSKGK